MEQFKIGGFAVAAAVVAIITTVLILGVVGYSLLQQPSLGTVDTISLSMTVVNAIGGAVASVYVLMARSVMALLTALRVLAIFMLVSVARAVFESLLAGGGGGVGLLPISTILLIVLAIRGLSKRGLVGDGSVFTVKPL